MDNNFAQAFCSQLNRSDGLPRYSYSSALCKRCTTVRLSQPVTIPKLRKKLKPCIICRILCRMQSRRSQAVNDRIQFLNAPSLRVCASPKTKKAHPDIQIGFPVLPASDSLTRFQLFREWLRVCDQNHTACCREVTAELPTRAIDVGDEGDEDSNLLRLYVFGADDRAHDRSDYIALSHCWGNLLEEQKRVFCTSCENIDERSKRGFGMAILPQTFQDAVIVTRKLGKRYLWIDSLCIIQYGDNFEDWKKEAKRMEAVFRNAYCTIAATSAEDSTKGFLRRPPAQHPGLQFIKVHSSSQGPIYISTIGDNFHEDIENGVLNQRAWVLQERSLSRRTIHFSVNQAYWECGDGVRCETLTHMRNSKALFLGDANFPKSLNLRSSQDHIQLFQSLFTTYSQLGITKSTDKPVAISGLEQRLASTFGTRCSYGVFEKYLHRSLLWQRSGSTRMNQIPYPNDTDVPSWSWMAYDGKIEYLEIDSGQVGWNEGVRLCDNMLQAQVRPFHSYEVERNINGSYLIVDKKGNGESGWLKYDRRRRIHLRKHRCVVIGREESGSRGLLSLSNVRWDYYVLVVRPICSEGRRFKRAGVGCISSGCILFRRGDIDESII